MATPALNSLQSLVAEYGAFWQSWPQFEQIRGGRHLVGYEVELIASHTSDLNHVDPTCPECRHVRSVLLEIAELMWGGQLQPRLRHVHNGLSLQLDRVLACLRQSLRGIREYRFVLEWNRWAVP
jgi:hypothetical protein